MTANTLEIRAVQSPECIDWCALDCTLPIIVKGYIPRRSFITFWDTLNFFYVRGHYIIYLVWVSQKFVAYYVRIHSSVLCKWCWKISLKSSLLFLTRHCYTSIWSGVSFISAEITVKVVRNYIVSILFLIINILTFWVSHGLKISDAQTSVYKRIAVIGSLFVFLGIVRHCDARGFTTRYRRKSGSSADSWWPCAANKRLWRATVVSLYIFYVIYVVATLVSLTLTQIILFINKVTHNIRAIKFCQEYEAKLSTI
jgi:hypothetical protein